MKKWPFSFENKNKSIFSIDFYSFILSNCNIERSKAQFHNTFIRLRFNPIYFKQNCTYFKQFYQGCLKQFVSNY